jgi:hypothetical protein
MPTPKSVELGGIKIEDVLSVSISLYTPTGASGAYEGRTSPATIQIVRRARTKPMSELFDLATNEDGRMEFVKGKIVLQNARKKDTYTIEIDEAIITGWDFSQPQGDSALTENVTIVAGKITLSGGGKSAPFRVPDFYNNV